MVRIAVLVSGGGSNLQAILDAKASGHIRNGEICGVISSNPEAYALTRAETAGVPGYVVHRKEYGSREEFTKAIMKKLDEIDAELIVLAGFLYILSADFCEKYENRVINVHPALIPAFCGDGYYGLKVHEKVIAYGVKLTGATVHFVNPVTDGGPIILQKSAPVYFDDTPEVLQRRVMEQCEWKILPEAVELYCDGRLRVRGNRVEILA